MKRFFPVLLACFLTTGAVSASVPSGTVTIPSIPADLAGFLRLRDSIARTPQGGAAVFVVAGLIYIRNRALGRKCLTIALDRSQLRSGSWYKGFAPSGSYTYKISRLLRMPFLPGIYIQGTTPAGGYALPEGPLNIRWNGWKYERGGRNRRKIFLHTTSGNLPRPLMMARNNRGIWKVRESSSFFVGPVKMPVRPATDDDL